MALAVALAAAIWTGPSAEARPPGNAAEPPVPVRIAPGAAGAYEGTVIFTRSSGSTVADTTRHDAKLVYAARDGAPGPVQVLIVRFLAPEGSPESPLVAFDDVLLRPDGPAGFAFETAGKTPPELEEGIQKLESLLPIEFLPRFPVAAPGAETRSGAEVNVLGEPGVKLTLIVGTREEDGALEASRRIEEGSRPAIVFQGDPAVLAAWSETYSLDPKTGVPARVEKLAAIEIRFGEDTYRFESRISLRAKSMPGGGATALLAKEVNDIHDAFAAITGPDVLEKRITALEKAAKGSVLEPVLPAFKARLKAYRGLMLGVSAPDFTLESLDGRQVKFAEVSRGKVTLLDFWGVDCPPCRLEAPHLTSFGRKYGERGFTVVAVNGYDEPKDVVEEFFKKAKLDHLVLLEGQRVGEEVYGVEGYPTAIWIDHEGKIVGRETGFTSDSVPGMEKRIEKLLEARDRARKKAKADIEVLKEKVKAQQ